MFMYIGHARPLSQFVGQCQVSIFVGGGLAIPIGPSRSSTIKRFGQMGRFQALPCQKNF